MDTDVMNQSASSVFRRKPSRSSRAARVACCSAALITVVITLPGCSSLGSFAGIPSVSVNRVPREFLGRSKAELVETNKLRLRQTPPEVYQLAANDVLGVYIENVIGNPEEAPPVHFPEEDSRAPSIGYPIPVREDGTIALPLVDPILIDGLTVNQATEAIRKAYTVDRQILKPGSDRIIVTLMRRRHYRVMVIREEAGGIVQTTTQGGAGVSTKRGTGFAVDLPAYENDLLHALTETGGMPGLDAKNEVIIMRGNITGAVDHDLLLAQLNNGIGPCGSLMPLPDDPNSIHIPLRFYPENPPRFTEEDILLGEGDVVYVPSRENEKFYTGGVLGGGEFLLPRDYDLDILKAIAIARGPVGASGSGLQAIGSSGGYGGFGGGGGGGASRSAVPPSRAIIIRKIAGMGEIPIRVDLNRALTDPSQRILIMPEDVIIVQYTCCEEIVNAALNIVQFNFLYGIGGRAFR
jgi:protein involved in polysaccharide export with SLBB domain